MNNFHMQEGHRSQFETEERFRRVFESASDAMALSDPNGIVVDANPAYFELYGFSAEEVIGQKFYIIFPAARRHEAMEQYRQVFNGENSSMHFESEVVRKDGTSRRVETRIGFIMRDGKRAEMLSVIRDVTERKQAEAQLEKYAQDLRRSNTDLEQFASVASHDLQEPLRMITSYLDLIEQRYASVLDEDAQDFIRFALDGAVRMKSLITGFLSYARLKTDEQSFAPFSAEFALDIALMNLQVAIDESNARITHDPLPEVNGNKTLFVYLLQNLISNALKFHGQTAPEIHISVRRTSANEWQFAVKDNGIGIDITQLDRIFVIFQRIHPIGTYTGAGIGLATCKKIVEHHNGQIWAESTVGEGTTFYFTIPASIPVLEAVDK
jgi:PAS domain S-box-containing protein